MPTAFSRREFLGGAILLATLTGGFTAATVALGDGTVDDAGDRLRVVATTGQVADAARNVGGDLVHVAALMGPGIDPHTYTPAEGDLARIFDAQAVLYSGHHLEGRFEDVFAALGDSRVLAGIANAVPEDLLLGADVAAGQVDPHIWADPVAWDAAIAATADVLARADPGNAATYQANAERYRAEVAAFDVAAMTALHTVPEGQRVLVTAHDAFGYFGRRFGYEVVGIQGISTETEAGINDLQRIASFIADRQIPAIFVESTISPATIEAVQASVRDRGFDVTVGGSLYADALGAEGTPEGTYLGMFRHNVITIATALGGDPAAVRIA
ncbi:MAG TPA: zinc ABC transporter substrate-binding protein [Thermomicrobiales bacterium]|nr:zinc ABC transporter substrate-binding protein [Thermomicrobiales bacterium]